jgi:hypothetical protein
VVAGRLAARHGISVSLRDSEPGGVVARIHIPAELVESSVAGPVQSDVAPVGVEPVGQVAVSERPVTGTPAPAPALVMGPSALVAPAPPEDPTPVTQLGADPAQDGAHFADAGPLPRRVPAPGLSPDGLPDLASADSPGAHFAGSGPLPRRVAGASLSGSDDVLRRDRTPDAQTPWAVSNSLSDYLNNHAGPPTDRPTTEAQ